MINEGESVIVSNIVKYKLLLIVSALLLLSVLHSGESRAAPGCAVQGCARGYFWSGGLCRSWRSNMAARCPAGYRLDRKTGVCKKPGCKGCREPVCPRGETYVRKANGVCRSRKNRVGKVIERPAKCPAGWKFTYFTGTCLNLSCYRNADPNPNPFSGGLGLDIRPDLLIKEFVALNYGKACQRGKPISLFRIKLHNAGFGLSAVKGANIKLKIYDIHYARWGATVSVGRLRKGETRTYLVRLNYLTSKPAHMSQVVPHRFIAKVDYFNRLREKNENNNSSRIMLLGRPAACVSFPGRNLQIKR